MTDFLTRVAQRAIGVSPAIQPLAGARYEPARLPPVETPDSAVESRRLSGVNHPSTERRSRAPSAPRTREPVGTSTGRDGTEDKLASILEQPIVPAFSTPREPELLQPPLPQESLEQPGLLHETIEEAPLQQTTLHQALLQHVPLQEAPLPPRAVQQESLQEDSFQEESFQETPLQQTVFKQTPPQQEPFQQEPLQQELSLETALPQLSLQPSPLLIAFDPEEASSNQDVATATRFELQATTETASSSPAKSIQVLTPRKHQVKPIVERLTGYSALEEAPLVDEDPEIVEPSKMVERRSQELTSALAATQSERDAVTDNRTGAPDLETRTYTASNRRPPFPDTPARSFPVASETVYEVEGGLRDDRDEPPAIESELAWLVTTPLTNRQPSNNEDSVSSETTRTTRSSFRPPVAEPPERDPQLIRVTIGRIDVRAVTPPQPVIESPAPPGPKLSLDEFLRQHNGRRE
jgi:hypothetical protein